MPDVTRSDSQRSDASFRPRVSFNRDVHVKRIVPREVQSPVPASGEPSHYTPPSSLVRKQRLPKDKQQLAEEAALVLQQVDSVDCVSSRDREYTPEKYYTLPARQKNRHFESPQSSLDRKKTKRRNSEESLHELDTPPKKPPRTFAHYPKSDSKSKPSIFHIFKKSEKEPPPTPKKSNLRRAVSDVSNLKSKAYGPAENARRGAESDNEDISYVRNNESKKLSPIIETIQREDYFSETYEEDKENVDRRLPRKQKESVTEQLKEYIDEVDSALFHETGIKVDRPPTPPTPERLPEVVIIDVEKAEKISRKPNKKSSLGKRIKALTTKKEKKKPKETTKPRPVSPRKERANHSPVRVELITIPDSELPQKSLPDDVEDNMIHSSQLPPEKLPLTRGRTVDSMVKRLSHDNSFPPPKTNIMITPSVTVQHNGNQPFSYTRGVSPERNYRSPEGSRSPNPGSPVIYAHVVCDRNGNNKVPTKQTVHTAYTNGKKHLPHSDSDEGLGYEENSGFTRKYEHEKSVTHFGDDRYEDVRKSPKAYEAESPITPKFKKLGYNKFGHLNEFTKTQHSIFIDSSSRGRGDGMDSKRRESLTEPHENGFTPKFNGFSNNISSRTDLSARRDLLESRINRRLSEKGIRPVQSPEYLIKNNTTPLNSTYITETTSKYYRHGSTSPVGFTEKYTSESKLDKRGEQHTSESRIRKRFGDDPPHNNNNRYRVNEYRYNYDNEHKSFDSQLSDYRSSPENSGVQQIDPSHDYRYIHSSKYLSKTEKQKLSKDKDHYKSNPEILRRNYENAYKYDSNNIYQETYHDSLRREKQMTTKRYLDQNECERKDKLGDSGIENDFKRDGDNLRTSRSSTNRREYFNDSEDEGFASSLLIASERQHTEENFHRKSRRDYDSDRGYRDERDDPYKNMESMEYKRDYKMKDRYDYTPRERSIDDGSHYDPRIDKEFDGERNTIKRRVEKKPPKPEKKSSLEKVKQLFTRDSSKKKKEQKMVKEDVLRSRYTEYKGSRENLPIKNGRDVRDVRDIKGNYDYSSRRRLSTPSSSPTREVQRNGKPESTHGSWFKSLDRLARKKSKKDEKDGPLTSEEEAPPPKATPTKNLRFFGDTDIESNDSLRQKPSFKGRPTLNGSHYRSQSHRDLHNISEEHHRSPDLFRTPKGGHKSLQNIPESEQELGGSRLNLKPPISPNPRNVRDVSRGKDDRNRRRRNEVSSVESSTEGDSSQQSQRSVVYLHAATVGDIPGPGYLRTGRRAASREELTSNGSSNLRPHTRTLSRSFSVLAPWRPKHPKEAYDIDYTQYPKPVKNGKYEQKPTKNGNSRKDSSSTLKKKANEMRRSNQSISTLRKSRSKENLSTPNLKKSKEDVHKGSSSTLYKKRERQPKENNSRYSRDRDEKRIASKCMSVESLGNGRTDRPSRENGRDVSRSVSMPRDPEKSAGWFRMNKKSKKSLSTQRL